MKRSRLSNDEWKCIISKDIFRKRVNSEQLIFNKLPVGLGISG